MACGPLGPHGMHVPEPVVQMALAPENVLVRIRLQDLTEWIVREVTLTNKNVIMANVQVKQRELNIAKLGHALIGPTKTQFDTKF